MPRYPGYRFASEFHRDGRPVDETVEMSFLRVFANESGTLLAGLHPYAQATDDGWNSGTPLTDTADALNAAAEHPDNQPLQQERLLVAAYQRLAHDQTTPRNVYVPEDLRPWAARFELQGQKVLLYVQAATENGARYATTEMARLMIRDQEEATFTRME